MITINIDGELYELVEIQTDRFLVTQNEPYKNLRHSLYRQGMPPTELDGNTVLTPSIYMYQAIRINGKFYGAKLKQ